MGEAAARFLGPDEQGAAKLRRLSPFERPEKPRELRIGVRDLVLFNQLLEHRFLELHHFHALAQNRAAIAKNRTSTGVAQRLLDLWRAGYLHRPESARGARAAPIVYALAPKGAEELIRAGMEVKMSVKDLAKTRKWSTMDHEISLSTFMVCVRSAVASMQAELSAAERTRFRFEWTAYEDRDSIVTYTPKRERIQPDGYFEFQVGESTPVQHFIEMDMGTKSYENMHERYRRYHEWWKANRATLGYVKLLTIAHTTARMEGLRAAAADIGKSPKSGLPWQGFLFATLSDFDLAEPERVLRDPIFNYATTNKTVSLI